MSTVLSTSSTSQYTDQWARRPIGQEAGGVHDRRPPGSRLPSDRPSSVYRNSSVSPTSGGVPVEHRCGRGPSASPKSRVNSSNQPGEPCSSHHREPGNSFCLPGTEVGAPVGSIMTICLGCPGRRRPAGCDDLGLRWPSAVSARSLVMSSVARYYLPGVVGRHVLAHVAHAAGDVDAVTFEDEVPAELRDPDRWPPIRGAPRRSGGCRPRRKSTDRPSTVLRRGRGFESG